jgi:hypothetical protein
MALLVSLLALTPLLGTACDAQDEAAPSVADIADAPADVAESAQDAVTEVESPVEAAPTTAAEQPAEEAVPPTLDADQADNAAYNEAVRAEIEGAVSDLFVGAIGETDPAWHDVTVRRMNTRTLARLRQQPAPPADAYRVAEGSVWVVGFRTDHEISQDTMLVDNAYELQEVSPEDYPDADGRTTIYYILSVTERGTQLQYTPLARGILPASGAVWTLDELAEIESE